jgi:hypothetical protein
MTAAARKVNGAARPSALAVFTARCEARALLWKDGELDLHQAVDELWASAVRDGLVGELGTDKVQSLLADAFAPMRDDLLELQEIEAEPEDTADYDGSTFAQPSGRREAVNVPQNGVNRRRPPRRRMHDRSLDAGSARAWHGRPGQT